ncbi:MAG: hypothetical protein ACRETL_14690 [Gammaproteobacteria bacterium]
MQYVDVYVDDFLALAQGSPRRQLRCLLFHTIDTVLRPLVPSDGPHRKEPISVKKLLKGDACWSTTKTMLGWQIDTVRGTIELPLHRYKRLCDILQEYHPLGDESRSGNGTGF